MRLLLFSCLLGLGSVHCSHVAFAPNQGVALGSAASRRAACSPTAAGRPRAGLPLGRRGIVGLRAEGGGELVEVASKRADAVVQRYWDGMNSRDIEYAMEQFADEIFFQDMMFQKPFSTKAELREHFNTCLDGFPEGMRFVIDEISTDSGDGKCGTYWHCETAEGRAFPFSRGVSFYKVNEEGKIIFAREIPEPSTKPGKAGLGLAKFGASMLKLVPESIQWPKV